MPTLPWTVPNPAPPGTEAHVFASRFETRTLWGALRFLARGGLPFSGHAVTAAPVGVGFTFVDEPGALEPRDGRVQRARAQLQLAGGQLLDVLHDAVAMPRAVEQREEDVELVAGQHVNRPSLYRQTIYMPAMRVKRDLSIPEEDDQKADDGQALSGPEEEGPLD